MRETHYLDQFLAAARRNHPEAVFVDGVSFQRSSNQDYDRPARYSADVIEIDGSGRLHLWMFASVFSPEVASGDAIGRLFSIDRVFRAAGRDTVRARLRAAAQRRRYDTACPWFARRLARLRPEFESWNLVVCGGRGCELVGAEDNLLFQLYAPLSEMIAAIRDVNTWHFYRTLTGFDLRSLWDVAGPGRLSAEERVAVALGRPLPLPAPADDFDIATKRDLHLKRRKGLHAEAWSAYCSGGAQARAG